LNGKIAMAKARAGTAKLLTQAGRDDEAKRLCRELIERVGANVGCARIVAAQ